MATEFRVLSQSEAAAVTSHRMRGEVKITDVSRCGRDDQPLPDPVQRHCYRPCNGDNAPHPETQPCPCPAMRDSADASAGVSVMSGDLDAATFHEAHVRLAQKCLCIPASRVLATQHPEWSEAQVTEHLQQLTLTDVAGLARQASPPPPPLECFTRQGPPHVPGCNCVDNANGCSRLVYASSQNEQTFNDHKHYQIQPERQMALAEIDAMATCQVRLNLPTADDWQACPVLPVAFRAAAGIPSDLSDLPTGPPGILDAIQTALASLVDVYIERPANRRVFSLEDIFYAMYMVIRISRQPWTFCGLTPDDPEWLDETVVIDQRITIPHRLAELLYRCIRGSYGIDDCDPAFRGVAHLVANTLLIDIASVQALTDDPPEPDGFLLFADEIFSLLASETTTRYAQEERWAEEWDPAFLIEMLAPSA